MKSRPVLLIMLLFWSGLNGLKAQRQTSYDRADFERLIENLLPVQEENVSYNDLYDRLFSSYIHHLNLNESGREDLQALYILTDDQIDHLLAYRKKYGAFLSKYELATVDGFDRKTAEQLLYFVDIEPPGNVNGRFTGKFPAPGRNDLLIRSGRTVELPAGFVTQDSLKRFKGGPLYVMTRYTLAHAGSYSLGVTVEQDPGEIFAWKPQARRFGMDYWSFHAMIENRGVVKKFIVGDYSLEFGQGLIFGSGFRTGKGSDAVRGIRRNSRGVRPYRSVFEHRDFSGFSITLEAGHCALTGFASLVSRDAKVYSDTLRGEDPYISSIRNTGLHRNLEELKVRQTITEKAAGFNFHYKAINDRLVVGVNGVKTVYSRPVVPQPRNYNRFAFSGTGNAAGSLYANLSLKNLSFFGETGLSGNGGVGLTGGLLAELSSYAALSVLYRNYSRGFHTLYGNAFGEDYRNNNEEGFYTGLKITPVRRISFSFFFDRFHFPWMRYRADGPSGGYEAMAFADYRPADAWSFRFLYRVKKRELNGYDENDHIHHLEPALKQWVRLDADWNSMGMLSLRTRIMMSSYRFCDHPDYGYLLAQDILLNGRKLFARGRVAYFNTNDYDTRQFVYEQDLLYVYSVPFFYGKGWRYYIVTGLQAGRKWTFWLKIAQTRYAERPGTGTGMDEIPGNVITQFKTQVRVKF